MEFCIINKEGHGIIHKTKCSKRHDKRAQGQDITVLSNTFMLYPFKDMGSKHFGCENELLLLDVVISKYFGQTTCYANGDLL